MKKFVIIGLLIVIAGAAVVAMVNLNSIVNSKKDFLTQRIEKSLGRKINVGKVGIGFGKGLRVVVGDLSISDLPAFSSEPVLRARNLRVKVKILPLFRKRLEVKSVELGHPVVNIIRDEKGRLNVSSFKRETEESGGGMERQEKGMQPLVIALFNINDGEVTFEDRISGAELNLSQIDSKVEGMDMSGPIKLDLRGSIFSTRRNLEIKGTLSGVEEGASFDNMQFAGRMNLSDIDKSKLLESGILSSPSLSIPRDVDVSFLVRGGEIIIDSLLFELAGGRAICSGRITKKGNNPSLDLQVGLKGAEVQEFASGKHLLKDRLNGEMHLDMDLQAAGADMESFKRNLTARGNAGLAKGKIIGLNIAAEVLREIAKYPGMKQLLDGKLVHDYPKVFKAQDTEIKEWKSDFILKNGRISLGRISLQAGEYSLDGKGYVGLNLDVNIAANMVFSHNLSRDIVGEVALAQYFTNNQGSIVVPMRLSGRFPKIAVSPNEEVIRKKLQEALLKGGLKELLPKKAKDLIPH